MMNHKLLVFIIAFVACGLLPCAEADGKFKIRFDFSAPLETIDAISVDDLPKLVPAAQKYICAAKLARVVLSYSSLETITKSDFAQLCKNFTVVNKCYANAGSGLGSDILSDGIEHMYGRLYDCNLPIFKSVLRLCDSTYEDALDTLNCYHYGMAQFSGSAEEAKCRQKCCHDPSTFNASEPMLCGPGRHFMDTRYCSNGVLDQTLKDNACQARCAVRELTHYALNFCSDTAALVFNAYQKEALIKYMLLDECFETCPSRD